MGVEYNKRAVGQGGGITLPVNTVTLSSAAATLLTYGVNAVTYDSSGSASDAIIPGPKRAGDVVAVVFNNGTTSLEGNFNTSSTGVTLFGSTLNTITAASTGGSLVPHFELVAVSTSEWALTSISSTVDWTIAATTGSTGQA